MSFDYDRWLESPYTDGWECSTDDCPVCTFECDDCDGTGITLMVDDDLTNATVPSAKRDCEKCDGNGTFIEYQSKADHKDYWESDERDDD